MHRCVHPTCGMYSVHIAIQCGKHTNTHLVFFFFFKNTKHIPMYCRCSTFHKHECTHVFRTCCVYWHEHARTHDYTNYIMPQRYFMNMPETQKCPVGNILLPSHRNGIPDSETQTHKHRHTQTLTRSRWTTRQLEASGRRGCLGNGGKEPSLFVLSIFSFGLKRRGIKTPGEREVICPDGSFTLPRCNTDTHKTHKQTNAHAWTQSHTHTHAPHTLTHHHPQSTSREVNHSCHHMSAGGSVCVWMCSVGAHVIGCSEKPCMCSVSWKTTS